MPVRFSRLGASRVRLGIAGVAAILLVSSCGFFAHHAFTPGAALAPQARRTGDELLTQARARARDTVVVEIRPYDLARTTNRAVREVLLRFGTIERTGRSRVDFSPQARRTLAPCPYPDDSSPYQSGCRRLPVGRLRSIALTSYTDDYQGFETRRETRSYGFRFTAEASNAIGRELVRRRALRCTAWTAADEVPPDIVWTPNARCLGSLDVGDADVAFDVLSVPSGLLGYADPVDLF